MNRFLSVALIATAFLTTIQANPQGTAAATAAAEVAAAAEKPSHIPEHHHSHHAKHHTKHHMTPEEMAKACMDELTKVKEMGAKVEDKGKKAEFELNISIAELFHKIITNPDVSHAWKHKAACMRHLRKAKAIANDHHKHHAGGHAHKDAPHDSHAGAPHHADHAHHAPAAASAPVSAAAPAAPAPTTAPTAASTPAAK